jgi:hypothetical protein
MMVGMVVLQVRCKECAGGHGRGRKRADFRYSEDDVL